MKWQPCRVSHGHLKLLCPLHLHCRWRCSLSIQQSWLDRGRNREPCVEHRVTTRRRHSQQAGSCLTSKWKESFKKNTIVLQKTIGHFHIFACLSSCWHFLPLVKHSFVQPFELMFANRNSSNQHPDGSGQDPRMVFIRDSLEFNPGPFSVHLHLPEMYFMLIKVKLKQTTESKNCLLCKKKIYRSSSGYYFLCCVRMAVKFLCICKGKVESICSLLLLFQSFFVKVSRFYALEVSAFDACLEQYAHTLHFDLAFLQTESTSSTRNWVLAFNGECGTLYLHLR